MSNEDSHAEEVGYVNHTGFGGLIGQQRPGFAGAATKVVAATAHEAVTEAGLDWTVSKRPLWFTGKSNGSKPKKVENAFAMVKDDDETYLGTVGKQYHPIQNLEAFDWADMIDGEYIAGGAMRTNRNVYVIKKLTSFVVADDPTDMYLMLRSSHDGTKSLSGLVTPVRVRCMNMMPIATRRATNKFAVRHVTSYADKLEQAGEVIKLSMGYAEEFKALGEKLADTRVLIEVARTVLEDSMPGRTELVQGVLDNLATSSTISEVQRGTAWGVLNATTEYLEWMRDVKTPTHALQANLDGQGARIRNAVAARLLAVAS